MHEEGRRQSQPSRRLVMRKSSLQYGKGMSLMDVNAAGGANLIVPDFDFNQGTSFRAKADKEETREDELYRKKILEFTRRAFINVPLILAIICYCGITAIIIHIDSVRESAAVQYMSASHSGLAFFSAFVGFILVFRTQICYNRWWEGRCLWGDLIFSAINLAQQGQSSFHDKENLRRLCCLIVNFAFACKSQLCGMSIEDDGDYLLKRGLISKEELQSVASRLGWQPYYFLGGMREIIDKDLQFSGMMAKQMGEEYSFKGSTTDAQLIIMDGALGILASNIGSLIRVKATGLPLGYDSIFYFIFLLYFIVTTLSWAAILGWYTPILMAMLHIVVRCITVLGTCLEDPFGNDITDLPLGKFCKAIEIQVAAVYNDKFPKNNTVLGIWPNRKLMDATSSVGTMKDTSVHLSPTAETFSDNNV